jgi:DNA N-6-adenine-methyltransferase (Dam)
MKTFSQPEIPQNRPILVDENSRRRGRPAKYHTPAERQRAHVQSQTAYRQRLYFRVQCSGEHEWYTPAPYLEAVRQVLGTIDLDPASSHQAQAMVQATRYFTAKDLAFCHAWGGRVFLNPPYSQPLIGDFVTRLVEEVKASHVVEAILLTHNSTDAKWFQVAELVAACLCFTRTRIKFVDTHGHRMSPTQGQAFFYFGSHAERFAQVFSAFGSIVQRMG